MMTNIFLNVNNVTAGKTTQSGYNRFLHLQTLLYFHSQTRESDCQCTSLYLSRYERLSFTCTSLHTLGHNEFIPLRFLFSNRQFIFPFNTVFTPTWEPIVLETAECWALIFAKFTRLCRSFTRSVVGWKYKLVFSFSLIYCLFSHTALGQLEFILLRLSGRTVNASQSYECWF